MGDPLVFGILAIVAIVAALMMVTSHNSVHSALWLVLNFATIAVFYVILNAPFIAMVQITVYAGAIMVLFLFVIMLLGAEQLRGAGAGVSSRGERFHQGVAVVLGVLLVTAVTLALMNGGGGDTAVPTMPITSPQELGLILFETYVFPFEVTGVLLLAAIIGVAIFTLRKKRGTAV
ncbi:MAG: NADH-quinone oxidoreductase subunit J [Anaerolineae bacterium]|nr:NADH-quinone oxidoreductase subunit J [Anaerolineae bacterium]